MMNIILFLTPIILHVILSPIWIVIKNGGILSFVEPFVNAIIIPVFLTTIIVKRGVKNSILSILVKFLISSIVSIVCCFISYSKWGISTGYFFRPDSETILIFQTEVVTAVVVLAIGLSIAYFIKFK